MPAAGSRILALVTGLALVAAPGGARAWAPPDQDAEPSQPSQAEPEHAEPQPEDVEPSEPGEGEEPELAIEKGGSPSGGGMVGAGVDRDDPNAKRAQSDLEGESLDDKPSDVPERLPKLQAAGWWLVFGGVGLAAAGGVLAGLAETREDEAERLAYGFDFVTGKTTIYSTAEDEWKQTLREGQAFESAARGLVIAGSVVLLAGVGLFIADAVQRKRGRDERPRVRVQPGATGMLLRF